MKTSKLFHQQTQSPIEQSTSKVATESTQPSSSGDVAGVLAAPSKPSASTGNLPTLTTPMQKLLESISKSVPTEEDERHALFLSTAVLNLESNGLCARQRVLAEDGQTVLAIRVLFSPKLWTEDLNLK